MNINEMILGFINSKDIADHLKNIGYQFSTPEASFLVDRSHKHTLNEKFAAWNRIITEMPDCTMARRTNMVAIKSIHRFLEQYIEMQNQKLEYIHQNDGAVYFYAIHYEEDKTVEYSRPFSSFEKCMSFVKEELEDMKEYKATEIFIKKCPLDISEKYEHIGVAHYNCDFELMHVEQYGLSEEQFDIDEAFEGMWFRIPTPFKKGDIVIEPTRSLYTLEYDVPLVLSDDIWDEGYINDKPKDKEWREKLIKRLLKNGDTTDMTYSGYWLKDDGIYYEVGHDYLSLEYYRKPLTDEYRFLKALSMYLKDECTLDFLINAKDIIFGEKNIKERKSCLNQINEIIKAVGIEK